MSKKERDFQKHLAYSQVGATVAASIGAVVMSMGIAMIIFGASYDDNPIHKNNLIESGYGLIAIGGLTIFFGSVYFMLILPRMVNKNPKLSDYGILFDEMYDGKDIEFANKGYDTYSVKKLRLTGEPLQYDYSVLKYVEENKMILITEDGENYGGCIENDLQCIKLGQDPSVDEIEKALEDLKKANDSKE